MGGDFYSVDDDLGLNSYAGGPIRPIRPYAWPLLLQSGGLAKINGNKLALTGNGKKAFTQPFEQSIKTLYSRWRVLWVNGGVLMSYFAICALPSFYTLSYAIIHG